jgi:hypothetical protein
LQRCNDSAGSGHRVDVEELGVRTITTARVGTVEFVAYRTSSTVVRIAITRSAGVW